MAAARSSNTFTASMTWSARLAAARAFSLGQPSRGLTSLSSDRPKFAMARATMPIFSPSCGSTRTMAGPAVFWESDGIGINQPCIAAIFPSLTYSAAKMKHSQRRASRAESATGAFAPPHPL